MVEKKKKDNYKSSIFGEPLFVGSKKKMDDFVKSRGLNYMKTHKIKKLPMWSRDRRVTKRAYGIFIK